MTKKILCGIPGPLLARINWIATQESRNRSDVMREALRLYEKKWKDENPGKEVGTLESVEKP